MLLAGQSAGADAVGEHLVREKSWGLYSAAALESGAFYTMAPPTRADAKLMPCAGPSPGAVTVAEQNRTWSAMMERLGCASATDIDCALNTSAERLLLLGGQPKGTCSWVPTIDGEHLYVLHLCV